MNTFTERRSNEANAFATASFLLGQASHLPCNFTSASLYADCNEATDIVWHCNNGNWNIAVRERILSRSEESRFSYDVTIRATGELVKLLTYVDGIVYIRRNAQHKLYGYSIVSVARLRQYLKRFDLSNPDWWKQTNGFVTLISYDKEQEPFYAFNFSQHKELLISYK